MSFLLSGSFDFSYIFKTVRTKWFYYIALLVTIIILFCFFFFKKQPKRNNLTKTQKLCYTAILTSLCTLTNIFDIKISDELQLSFVATVGLIGGYLLGGGYGFAICFVGDLIGAIINPHGPYNPIIGIGTGFWGLIFGIGFAYFKGKAYIKLMMGYLLGFLIISAGINTVGFCLMYPTMYTFEILLPLLPYKFLTCVVNCILSLGIIKVLKNTLPDSKFYLE